MTTLSRFFTFLITLCLSVPSTSFAKSADVLPKNIRPGDAYIRVLPTSTQSASFERCLWKFENETCRSLGNKKSYTLEELRSERAIYGWKQAGAWTGAAAAVALSIVASAQFGFAAIVIWAGKATTAVYVTAGGSLTIAGGSAVALAKLDAINPFEMKRRGNTLSEAIITDQKVEIERSEMEDQIERFERVLLDL